MPLKRKRPTPDPLASDPEDEDYDDREVRPPKSHKKSRSGHKVRRKERYGGDDSEGSEELDDSEVSFIESDSEEEEPEVGPSGRPMRRAVKQATYEESSESEIPASDANTDGDDEEDEDVKPGRRSTNVVKLKIAPAKLGRVARQRTGSVARSLRGGSVDPATGARRSGRLNRETSEPLVALTDSGKHETVVEPGTASPEAQPARTTAGRKSIGKPHMSHISEEQDEEEEVENEERVPSTAEEEKAGGVDLEEAEEAIQSVEAQEEDDEDDDDDEPVSRRKLTRSQMAVVQDSEDEEAKEPSQSTRSLSRLAKGKKRAEKDDDFIMEASDQEAEEDDASDNSSPRKQADSPQRRQSQRKRTRSGHNSDSGSESGQELDPDEMADELEELEGDQRRSRRRRGRPEPEGRPLLRTRKSNVNYAIIRPDLLPVENEDEPVGTPSKRKGNGATAAWQRNLFSTFGPFGGAGGTGPGFTGGAGDSDSSDDERNHRAPGVGGATGMTPTTGQPPGLLGVGADPNALSGTPANLGKIKSRQALADADPLGVDPNVNFDQVGGLQDHINQLKEMVQLPLLYPEVFQQFKITPPRGVLFHGPPGTGKTLLARALAASCSTEGRKITFYMRKGADALSKWVGEAERQLRLLFEEARNTQPSIIFFDEIDGLAPVRSSKQEQIHASIVSTLLALMDGMDGRGQVIVIGATNRPDSIDPALRRPGRFDREFYFPLPSVEARKSIINIHTRGWSPPLGEDFKNQLADITKGYGGADLRALCTEAALNAIQRRYPQIYAAKEKLIIDPSTITVNARDFMISAKKMVPSSERSSASGASPLPSRLEPLLGWQLDKIKTRIDELIPRQKKKTALEEAMYEDYEDSDGGFGRERLQQAFESARVFRPRLLIRGRPGLGQSHLGAALLQHFEGLHVQSFDLSLLLSDSTRTPEAAVVQLFVEVKRHKPSVIYIPNVDVWYRTLAPAVVTTFVGLLRGIPPTEPILLLGFLESEVEDIDPSMVKDLFGYSRDNQYPVDTPGEPERYKFFQEIIEYIRKAPTEFPDPVNRKKRTLEILPIAPPPPPREPTREELKNQKKKDRQLLYWLKVKIQPIMDQIKLKYRKFRVGVIDVDRFPYLYPENQDPDRPPGPQITFRPYELDVDKHGNQGLREAGSGKFFYNLNIVIIEERLSNGYYKRPKDYLFDIRTLARDSKLTDDRDRAIKANEMLANVEVDIGLLEQDPTLADCENVYLREKKREEEQKGKPGTSSTPGFAVPLSTSLDTSGTTNGHSEGAATVRDRAGFVTPSRPAASLSNGTTSGHAESNGSNHNTDIAMIDQDMVESPVTGKAQGFIAPQKPASQYDSNVPQESQFSQKTGVGGHVTLTPMPPGSQPEDFGNDASTTTSGKKTDQSRSSGGQYTQGSNGTHRGRYAPSFSGFGDKSKLDSQLLATQEMLSPPAIPSSEPDSQIAHATQPPVPAFDAPSQKPGGDPAAPDRRLILSEDWLVALHQKLAEKTSGCTVEQMEQIFAVLMDRLWKERSNWNRSEVTLNVKQDFNEVIRDIQETQGILPASYPTDDDDDLGPSQA